MTDTANNFAHSLGCIPCHSRYGIWSGNEATHHASCHVVCRKCGIHATVTMNFSNHPYTCYDCKRT